MLGAVPGSSILYKFRKSSIDFEKSMSVLGILLGYQLERRKRRKRVFLKNRCETFRDNNHQSLYKNIKLYNDVRNPVPVHVNESAEYCYLQGLLRTVPTKYKGRCARLGPCGKSSSLLGLLESTKKNRGSHVFFRDN